MAAEDAAVTVSIRAELKGYEAALKSAVRMTERAAKAAEDAVGGVGKKSNFNVIQGGAAQAGRSLNAMQADAKNLTFQLNDITQGLLGGQSPFQVMIQQGSQVSQVLTGAGGITNGLKLVGSALVGFLNPISLVTSAFIFATGIAVQYFMASEDGGKEAAKALKEHRDLIREVANAYGDALPALKAFNDYLEAQEKNAKITDGLAAAVQRAGDELKKALQGAGTEGIDKVLGLFKDLEKGVPAVIDQWEEFKKHVADGTVTVEEAKAMAVVLNKTLNELPINAGSDLAAGFLKVLDPINKLIEQLKGLNKELTAAKDTTADLINKMVTMPPTLSPVTSAGGVLNPSQTEQEIAAGTADIELTRGVLKAKAATKAIADSLDDLTDDAVRALGKLFLHLPESARITSGFRTKAEQAEIRARHEAMPGGVYAHPAARPGHSLHEGGAAVDIGAGVSDEDLRAAVKLVPELEQLDAVSESLYQRDKMHVQLKSARKKVDKEAADDAERTAEQQADALVQLEKMITTEQQETALKEKINAINADVSLSEDQRALSITKVTAEAAKEAEVERLLAQAKEAGLVATPQLIAQYQALAQAKVNAIITDKQLAITQKEAAKSAQDQANAIKQFNQQIASMAQSAIGGLINDLRSGVDAGEAFNNMLNRIIDSLIQMSLQQLFSPAGGGGILSSLFGVAHSGGIVGQTAFPRRRVDPRVFAGAKHYASGGLVGGEVPIIAHRGEMIIPRNMVGKGGGSITNNLGPVSIDMAGTGLVAAGPEQAKQMGENIRKIIAGEMVRESRPGGLLRRVPT
jgi:Prophage tail length tape measure protein